MPIKIAAQMQTFVYEYHFDMLFQKHKQKNHDPRKGGINVRLIVDQTGGGGGRNGY